MSSTPHLPLATRSFWQRDVELAPHAPLAGSLTVDVCIVGAGLGGLTAAHRLISDGAAVAIVDALDVGAGETGRTTAHIATPDDRYWYIEKTFGPDAARLVAQSFAAALDCIETTVATERIDCDFRRLDGYLYSCQENPRVALEREYEAARRAGVPVMREPCLPAGFFEAGPCLRFPRQGQFHPLKYLRGLAECIESRRGVIHGGTRALTIEESADGVVVTTPTGKINAGFAVLATNTPFHERFAMHSKQIAYQTYAVSARVPRDSVPAALVWDDGDPYFYVRTTPMDDEHDLLIVGGADHKTGHASDPQVNYRSVEAWMRTRFPQVGEIAHRWSGEVMEPLDGLAYLGRSPGSHNVFIITGDSGNGMTHATIGGMLIADLITGRRNPWAEIYDPARKPLKEALQYMKEQSQIAAQYGDWVSAGDAQSVGEIARGEGALIRHGVKKFAIYRDGEGGLHAHSAACTHLGCVVQWNGAEKTWDCPCHGSRFSAYGAVIHGPAVTALAPAQEEEWRALVAADAKSGQRTGTADSEKRTRQ